MRLFEREADFFRECGYQDYLRFYNTNDNSALACRYIHRARRLEALADLLNPKGHYSYHSRYSEETFPELTDDDEDRYNYKHYYEFRPQMWVADMVPEDAE